MVKICPTNYSIQNDEKYKEHFSQFPFPLSPFQKHAIEAVVEEQHVLVTAATGSGKTKPAEFAIKYFTKKGKKVIYTSPIKALSNQKYDEFTKQFPDISFGVITGDIKINSNADCLIMTAEILLNKLYNSKRPVIEGVTTNNNNDFDIDIDNELGCVCMDEIHFIGDSDRGKIWEETIMMLPFHIQMVMLSATLDRPEKFSLWCENRIQNGIKSDKIVYLTGTTERIVPLTHYGFISASNGIFKHIKDKNVKREITLITDKPFVIQDPKHVFNDANYNKMTKVLKLIKTHNINIRRQFIINQVLKYCNENEMLPALCFVFSRKKLEICANEVTTNLIDQDSKIPNIVKRECEQIIRRLPNYKEYIELPEYVNMVSLLQKGIAIHHAGIIPILREMVEILYAKGYIKILFATETFSVGINMPTKTVIFTDITKYDGNGSRPLYSHEYTQLSGRAGRRGIDTVGNVIHLNNIFKDIEYFDYKKMLSGKPQSLVSKFKISYNLLLNLINIGNTDFENFIKGSMITDQIDIYIKQLTDDISSLQIDINKREHDLSSLKTPKNVMEEYINLCEQKFLAVNKKRKEIIRSINDILDKYKTIEQDKLQLEIIIGKQKEKKYLENELYSTKNFINSNIDIILDLLKDDGFISYSDDSKIELSLKGTVASNLKEVHCLAFSQLYEDKMLFDLSPIQLVSIFSCFTNLSVQDEIKSIEPKSKNETVENIIKKIVKLYDDYYDKEVKYSINTGIEYTIHFDLLDYVSEWCECTDEIQCKILLQRLSVEKGVSLGDFVKSLLKINNIACEFERVAEITCNVSFLRALREIPKLTLKHVVTTQSLYVF